MDKGVTREKIKEGLLVAGLIGVIVKHNASISGAECGCQAEIGTASSMGAGFLASINGGDIFDIERASEIALEHSLGLTCDPIEGYVQIPCIERNAIGAYRSMMSYALSRFMGKKDSKISLDNVIRTMYFTGKDLNKSYRETARGGLAKTYTKRIKKI
jgi:L-serine dehydratase